jgi:hypothetical protein
MARTKQVEPTWVVYLLGGKRAERLGTIRGSRIATQP